MHSEIIPYPRIFYRVRCDIYSVSPSAELSNQSLCVPPFAWEKSQHIRILFFHWITSINFILHSHTTLLHIKAAYDVTVLLHTPNYTQLPVIIPPRLLFTLLIPFRWNENEKLENQISFNGKLNVQSNQSHFNHLRSPLSIITSSSITYIVLNI